MLLFITSLLEDTRERVSHTVTHLAFSTLLAAFRVFLPWRRVETSFSFRELPACHQWSAIHSFAQLVPSRRFLCLSVAACYHRQWRMGVLEGHIQDNVCDCSFSTVGFSAFGAG